ncbi:TylF/MycF/NovP-related O-methyltransferase [Pseudanabaena sp. PCC 6802]|uniref:TylF/MycF/NovP-related O-methyltransferase n=1 Tax=Pseudanabaena sp. PCC 6802 TaxID=118173 RepID=UPI000345C1CA|nr:TylF/MycF/NovP-related O-methyltransferase [Pseudanabaena sp. PCC 6802]
MFYGVPDSRIEEFKQALGNIKDIFGQMFASDMLIALHRNLTFWTEPGFENSFLSTARDNQEKSLAWRLHTLTWAASHALHVEGDFVECGVFQGFSSAVICKYLNFATIPKQFYLYDTFSGLAEETSTEKERESRNLYYKSFDSDLLFQQVQSTFSAYPNVKVIRGIVPHSFEKAVPEKIAYLHIDMNSTKAEILALEALFDKISPGGMLILDDFGWLAHQDQALAEIKFMNDRGYKILELPTGQGLVLKR